jgi:protein-disulfide isomerase
MFCIIAFVVLAIMGIFSTAERELAREAFACVMRRVTFRPCNVGFREKMEARIVSGIMKRSIRGARIVAKNFELLSWIFFLLTVWSLVWTGQGVYNYFFYGSCNGLNASGFCVFDPTGSNNAISAVSSTTTCPVTAGPEGNTVTLTDVDTSLFPHRVYDSMSRDRVVFIGCYGCDYTRKAYPAIKRLVDEHAVDYTFAHFPIKDSYAYLTKIGMCAYAENPEKFWDFNDVLFSMNKEDLLIPEKVYAHASILGFDIDRMKVCTNATSTDVLVQKQANELAKTHLYGTPTLFINKQPIVGPKPYFVYRNLLWKWGR